MLKTPVTLSGIRKAAPVYMQRGQPMMMQPEVMSALATCLIFAIERLEAAGDAEAIRAIRDLGGLAE